MLAPRHHRSAWLFCVALPLAACTSAQTRAERDVWKDDWNARLEHAQSDWQHPCATRPFIAWADQFLAGCPGQDVEETAQTRSVDSSCESREDWVQERVEQCRAWTAWQLRNFNQHQRTEGSAPSMRIE